MSVNEWLWNGTGYVRSFEEGTVRISVSGPERSPDCYRIVMQPRQEKVLPYNGVLRPGLSSQWSFSPEPPVSVLNALGPLTRTGLPGSYCHALRGAIPSHSCSSAPRAVFRGPRVLPYTDGA